MLRAAETADVDAISRIWHGGWFDGHRGHVPDAIYPHRSLDAFSARVPARLAATTVAVVAGCVVGFVTVHRDELEQLYVDAAARGSGIAAALLAHAELVIADSHELAWLAVVSGNERACRFYARHGWNDAGPLSYAAEIDGDTRRSIEVPARRYQKRVAAKS